tara:strand:+ start:5565 stop:6035 length:471 start_codon:yes stop_codon:yes gene_type:complete
MKTSDTGFPLLKFRTMKPASENSGVSGADKLERITTTGKFIRNKRLDELPQLWNVIKGDISFVGPRPPLREYVERFPEIYDPVLQSRPGITGLASVYFNSHESHLLSRSGSKEETDEIYCRSCIPRKARIDLYYQNNQSMCFDLKIMIKTVFASFR